MKKPPLLLVKIGGNIIDEEKALQRFIGDFAAIGGAKILIHGGGKLASALSAQLGIETIIKDGRRMTDEATLRVVTMTYAGWINKTITASLQAAGCAALGLCGADANLMPAIKRPVAEIDYGWVGDLIAGSVNTDFVKLILENGITPVVAPITSNKEGHLLNINADTAAQAIAMAMSKHYDTTLVYCFEKRGVLSDVSNEASVIDEIKQEDAERLKLEGVIAQGMIPKIDNALSAVQSGVGCVIIGHAANISEMASKQKGYGTYIRA